jgi:hypothetical protein
LSDIDRCDATFHDMASGICGDQVEVAGTAVDTDYFVMPAKSKKQQMAAGAALSAKRGKKSKQALKGASRGMAQSMSVSELRKMAKTKRSKLPTKKRR